MRAYFLSHAKYNSDPKCEGSVFFAVVRLGLRDISILSEVIGPEIEFRSHVYVTHIMARMNANAKST